MESVLQELAKWGISQGGVLLVSFGVFCGAVAIGLNLNANSSDDDPIGSFLIGACVVVALGAVFVFALAL